MTTPSPRLVLAAWASSLAIAGCSLAGESGAANDCNSQVRVGDVVYTAVGQTDRATTRLSTAEAADCDDTGDDPRGSVFPEGPRLVETWELTGHATDEVLGVRADKDSVEVFIADSLPPEVRDRLTQDLVATE